MLKLLRCGVFESALSFGENDRTSERTSLCYELELYVSGKGMSVITNQNHKEIPHEKGTLLFFNPGVKRYSTDHFTCFFIHLDIDKETAKILTRLPLASKVINYKAYKKCFTDVIQLSQMKSVANDFRIQSKLYELFYMMIDNAEVMERREKSNDNTDLQLITDAIKFIEGNYQKNLTLQNIADSARLSPTYFHKLFKIHTGVTPRAFLLRIRLANAKMYLLTTSKSLEEIVELCGFSSLSYFDSIFKKNVGMTPSEFRKQKFMSLSDSDIV